MGCYRPKYPSATYQPEHRRPIPRARPRSPVRRRQPSTPPHKPAQSPWSFNTKTRVILWDKRPLDPWERELALLATRYPDCFDPAVSQRGVSRKRRPEFTEEEWKLLEVVKRWPLDLEKCEGVDKERRFYLKYSELELGSEMRTEGGLERADVPETDMMDQSSHIADAVASTSTSTAKPESESPSMLPSNGIPWSHDPRTGNVFANGTRLTCFERKIVVLASRHPDRVKDHTSFVPAGDAPLSDHEFALITAAAAHPIDLNALSDYYPSLPAPEILQPKRQALPKIHMDRAPWSVDKAARVASVDGEVLTKFERELVVRASIYPSQFKKTGEYKVGGKMTGWERNLVRAARKWPMATDMQDIEELRAKARERDMEFEKDEDEEKEHEKEKEKKADQDENVEMEDVGEVVQEADQESAKQPVKETQDEAAKAPTKATSKPTLKETQAPDLSKSKWATGKADRHTHHTTFNPNPRPSAASRSHLPPHHYAPTQSFPQLKKRILSNAHAYFSHRYPQAERFDVITSSSTPRNLASTQWRAALIVYPDPRKKEWKILYRSNVCPTVEDAAFEIAFWVEEDLGDVLEGMREGQMWREGDSENLEDRRRGEREKGREKGREKPPPAPLSKTATAMAKNQTTTSSTPATQKITSTPATATQKVTPAPKPAPAPVPTTQKATPASTRAPAPAPAPPSASQSARVPAQAPTTLPGPSTLKRKSRTVDDGGDDAEVNKRAKTSDDEPVMVVGGANLADLMGDEDAAAYSSLFGGDVASGGNE
ncbi:hypothetical protein HBH70_190150 [Parastagonospora nodorum]|nr:hypothetical protein HBH51_194070 [Parastagonospora nodorum]KAH4031330.1 hypothetical protein HBI09_123380 [Parastagonospora nodorum]KAH4290294.1 hypothetical protein HBI02_201960 [Parastagonospora nodorum]KAH4290384.1 hypothetical protein HBI01_202220 [Parastagonospora nodorum]KAH4322556.1 hypothetical protein HBI00_196730 [Parastagonospora nodorum]